MVDPSKHVKEGKYTYFVSTNKSTSIKIETDHIPSSHETKVLAQGIHPYVVLKFGVPDTDMP
jgi:hypothetical protein